MDDNIFKFSLSSLKIAQDKLRSKPVFIVDKDNYADYESFTLESLKGGYNE